MLANRVKVEHVKRYVIVLLGVDAEPVRIAPPVTVNQSVIVRAKFVLAESVYRLQTLINVKLVAKAKAYIQPVPRVNNAARVIAATHQDVLVVLADRADTIAMGVKFVITAHVKKTVTTQIVKHA